LPRTRSIHFVILNIRNCVHRINVSNDRCFLDLHRANAFVPLAIILVAMPLAGPSYSQNTPSGTVLTPFGPKPLACVHQVTNGTLILPNESVVLPTGIRIAFPICQAHSDLPSTSGWVEKASYNVSSGDTYWAFNSNWFVPNDPSYKGLQTVFLFNGLELKDGSAIIQPVLQWGTSYAGGGRYWSMASWYVSPSGATYVSTLMNVGVGDQISGAMYIDYCNGSQCQWYIDSTDVTTAQTSELKVTLGLAFASANLVLEVYNVLSCTEYPSSGYTTFSNSQLAVYTGGVNPLWAGRVDQSDGCGEKVLVNGNSVALYY
jgi:hypothetical protein